MLLYKEGNTTLGVLDTKKERWNKNGNNFGIVFEMFLSKNNLKI